MDVRDEQRRAGTCPTHGTVEATRFMPRLGFPFIVSIVRRALAGRQPYTCPECGQRVRLD